MAQVIEDPVQAGREALQRRAWDQAWDLLSTADENSELAPEDLELLGQAAQWTGHFQEWFATAERAYARYLEAGNRTRAAYMATELAHEYKNQLQPSVASGWLSRAKRLLDEEPESAEHGYWAIQRALVALGEHDFDQAFALGKQAEEIGRRFGDRSLEVRAMQRQGNALIAKGDVSEGKLLLDESAAAALAGELDPYSTLVVYCNTIGDCRDRADFDSAGEWTDRAHAFCEENSMSAFPGMCRVNHAEVMKYKGRLSEAHDLAGRAGEELRHWAPRIAGAAFYELGEVRLRLGELAQAEQAFREADEYGAEPEPGLSLLRLTRGDVKGALASIRRALSDDTAAIPARARLLPAGVEIAVAGGELETADRWAQELAAAADVYQTSALKAAAAFARGQVRLAAGEADDAFNSFREARTEWESTGATYNVARVREQLGLALRASGDEERAIWEFQAAAARFERLGAVRDAERVAGHLTRDVSKEVMKTFLFTDIVGSTALASRLEDRHWGNVLRHHDDTLRKIFAEHDGQVVDHTGDGFFTAFEDAAAAVKAAVEVQKSVADDLPFDLRIGLHMDGAMQRQENYHGKGVHAAARIGAAANAQEILASRATMDQLGQFKVTNPRAIALKGFEEPVEVCSVEWRS